MVSFFTSNPNSIFMFLEFEFTFSFSRLLKPDHQENEPRAGQERELNTSWPGRERIEVGDASS